MAVGVYGGRLGLTSAEARTVYRQAQRIVRSVAVFRSEKRAAEVRPAIVPGGGVRSACRLDDVGRSA